MSEVTQQWRYPPEPPVGASCSCTSCCPTGTSHMAQPGTDQHEGGVAVREAAHHTGTAADLPVKPFHDVISTDTGPMFTGKNRLCEAFSVNNC